MVGNFLLTVRPMLVETCFWSPTRILFWRLPVLAIVVIHDLVLCMLSSITNINVGILCSGNAQIVQLGNVEVE